MKILAFGASTSAESINRQFANFTASQASNSKITDLDLRDFNLPLYSVDEEAANGIPQDAHKFLDLIQQHDALVVSLAEHNGSYAAAFKNLYDWASRANQKVWGEKPMVLLSTSPGPRGGATVMEAAKATFPRMGANLVAHFSLPSFYENFSAENGIVDATLADEFKRAASALDALA
ncbi:MAG: NAD(P)H-dependent oxidoreductase [Verrucomicrobia bacterium]|jgi:chromate reductase, NAD(P)H dehydrogenase (quinone)|nr:NAD(P)H-dependent oxidoreductase [Verrucomicrobiota bacterium]